MNDESVSGELGRGFYIYRNTSGENIMGTIGGLIENADLESSGLRWGVQGCIDEAPQAVLVLLVWRPHFEERGGRATSQP